MRLKSVSIKKYRSIEDVTIVFPENRPVVLFGANNAGKSNILSAIDRLLGEKYPTYREMLDSDYFERERDNTAEIIARFDEPVFAGRGRGYQTIAVKYEKEAKDNLLHDGSENKIYPSNDERAQYQSFLFDTERNIKNQFSYVNQYTLLSKFSKKIHNAIRNKERLEKAFYEIKSSFEETPEYSQFFEKFSDSLKNAVKGFVHSLDVNFSAYDPNNYAKSLRICAKEGNSVRSFEEFGTGEQQVLLMAFMKAYMEVFVSDGEHFLLLLEEPEAHLHPLAQKWLKEYIEGMCKAGVQVVISTHSADFIDPAYIDGLVRVYKENGVTKVKQLSSEDLSNFCIGSGVPKEKCTPEKITDFYSTKLFPDQLKGLFAETILLVEGATEFYAFPVYFKKNGFSLIEHGIEIVNCNGKNSIPLFWRLFEAYGYRCFAIFDCDGDRKEEPEKTAKDFSGLINKEHWLTKFDEFEIADTYAYFGTNFEEYFRNSVNRYKEVEQTIKNEYKIGSKPGVARAVAQNLPQTPEFIKQVCEKLFSLSRKMGEEPRA